MTHSNSKRQVKITNPLWRSQQNKHNENILICNRLVSTDHAQKSPHTLRRPIWGYLKVGFHVGCLPTKLQIIMGWRCLPAVNNKPSNHITAVYQKRGVQWTWAVGLPCTQYRIFNPASAGHRKDKDPSNSQENQTSVQNSILGNREKEVFRWDPNLRRWDQLVWHIQTLLHHITSTSRRMCPYSHQNLVGKRCTWELTLSMPPSHLTLAKTQSISLKPGKAPLVIAEASGYSNAPTRTCSRDFQVGFS